MIPVNQNTTPDTTPIVKTPLVSPVAATQQRAESQMKEETKLGKPHVKLVNSIKRKKQGKRFNMKKAGKKRASKQSSAKIKKRTQSKKLSSKKNHKKVTSRKVSSNRKEKSKPQKRKLQFNNSVWDLPLVKTRKK